MSDSAMARISLVDARAHDSGFVPTRPRNTTHTAGGTSATPPNEPGPEPFALGFAAGELSASARFADERADFLRVLTKLETLQAEPSEELAAMIATTVERLVTELVGGISIDRVWLDDRIARAVGCITEADAARTLWLHPLDCELIADADLGIDVRADAALERGAVRIDCSVGWIEENRSIHLDALRALLGTAVQS